MKNTHKFDGTFSSIIKTRAVTVAANNPTQIPTTDKSLITNDFSLNFVSKGYKTTINLAIDIEQWKMGSNSAKTNDRK